MIHSISLSDVYAIDFGRRTEDFPAWENLDHLAPPGAVIEVGCGEGRLRRCFGKRPYHGIELDPVLAARARGAGVRTIVGDATQRRTWADPDLPPVDETAAVFCAYSTLYLVPHDRQRLVISEMARRLPAGGLLAIEVFKPEPGFPILPKPPTEIPVLSPNGPQDGPWLRRSEFTTGRPVYDAWGNARVTTEIVRRYGPSRDKWTMELRETVYYTALPAIQGWLVALGFERAGLVAPTGSLVLAGVRRW